MDSSRKAQRPEEIAIKHAKNGGYIVRHSFNNMGAGESYRTPEEHAFGDHKSMMAHVHKHTNHGQTASDLGANEGAQVGAGGTPKVAVGKAGAHKEARPTGTSGKAKAAPPSRRTYGAGVD
jgi:hypothetical protein